MPHAGYRYSGPVAAHGFAALGPDHRRIRRVVVISSIHRGGLRGLAMPSSDAFLTPLGAVSLDGQARRRLTGDFGVQPIDDPHHDEHGIEVQLPFLQRLIGNFELVPLLVGDADEEECRRVINAAWHGTPDTVVVLSSDLSRYNDYETARRLDGETRQALEAGDATLIEHRHACGHQAMRALLRLAQDRHLRTTTLAMRNSADCIGGDPNRAIGFGAFSFH